MFPLWEWLKIWGKMGLCTPVLDVTKQLVKTEREKLNPVHKDTYACTVATSTHPNRSFMATARMFAGKPCSFTSTV